MKNYENKIVYNEQYDVYVREDTHDLWSAREVPVLVKKLEVGPLDTVLDIGAHIGAFSRLCLKRGAKVIAVEPEKFNLEVLSHNVFGFNNTTVIEGCATNGSEPTVELHCGTNGSHTGLHSMFPSRGRDVITVPAYSFRTLLDTLRPSVLKVDIEGGEWTLDFEDLPDFVKRVHIEMHFMPISVKALARQMAPIVHQSMINQGFAVVKAPNLNVLWGTHPIYKRS